MTAFLLDTSAVIGLIERRSAAVRGVLSRATVDPVVSVLTLGELEHGVQVRGIAKVERARRRATADFAARLPTLGLPASTRVAACYGFVSVSVSRRAAWGDRWLVATAVVGDLEIVTEDAGIAALVDEVVWNAAWARPRVTLCPSS